MDSEKMIIQAVEKIDTKLDKFLDKLILIDTRVTVLETTSKEKEKNIETKYKESKKTYIWMALMVSVITAIPHIIEFIRNLGSN